jgi:aspartyl-tRNA(Asn)/glutamyl-tRNA(Gln) amidotransferase subunit A
VFPLAKSLDSLGPLCRTVQDAAWIDAAMCGRTAAATLPRLDLRDLSFVIPETVVFDGAEPGVVAAFEASIERLATAGARIRRQAFPEFSAIFEVMAKYGALVTAEAFVLHRERITGPAAAGMDPRVVKRTLLGEKISLSDYFDILAARERLTAAFEARLGPSDTLVSPTLPIVAPAIQPLIDDEDLFFQTNGKTLRNTLVGNFLDWCGVSLPCGTDADGMPVGLLLSGPKNSDERVLAVAAAVDGRLR